MVEGGIERRGRVYDMRMRVPTRFEKVETRPEVNRWLKTRCPIEAQARFAVTRLALHREWDAALRAQERPGSREVFDVSMALLQDLNLPYRGVGELAGGPIEDLVSRIERLADKSANSAAVPALLGGVDLPRTLVSEMPGYFERIRADQVSANNEERQLREWRNKYLRAAAAFVLAAGDKPMAEITAADARLYRKHWENKRKEDGVSTQYVNKQLGYLRQMVDAFYADLGLLPADHANPFERLAFEKLGAETREEEGHKLPLPVSWVTSALLDPTKTAGLNEEALGIAVVCAIRGAREAEIFDLPPEDMVLDHEIPHLRLAMVEEGEHKRELKNTASKRPVPLLGHALEVMRRFPEGFARYRGNAAFHATINKFFREKKLFPKPPEGSTRRYTFGRVRHTFEDRMKWAGIENEERALLMGHSLKAMRGRPV